MAQQIELLRHRWNNSEKVSLVDCLLYPDLLICKMIIFKGDFRKSIKVTDEEGQVDLHLLLPDYLANKKLAIVDFSVHFQLLKN